MKDLHHAHMHLLVGGGLEASYDNGFIIYHIVI